MRLKDRLAAFMARHKLKGTQFAKVLQTPYGTFMHWLRDESTPPACLLTLMDLLEQSPEARKIAGVKE